MDSAMSEALKERAKDDCVKYGAPNLGVDHSNYWKPMPYASQARPDSKQETE